MACGSYVRSKACNSNVLSLVWGGRVRCQVSGCVHSMACCSCVYGKSCGSFAGSRPAAAVFSGGSVVAVVQ